MKRRWKIVLGLLLLLLVVAASLLLTMHVQPQNELEAYKKFLRAQGEKLDLNEVIRPPAPDESNAVSAVSDAFNRYDFGLEKLPYAMQMIAPGKAIVGWQQPDARNPDFTNTWEEFAKIVAANEPAIELLHTALVRPRLDFRSESDKDNFLFNEFTPMRKSVLKLEAATILELHNGDTGPATTNILTILALVRDNAGEGLLVSHMVRSTLLATAFVPTWEFLQATNGTDAQLAAIQRGWLELDLLGDAENTVLATRAWSSLEVEKTRTSHKYFEATLGPVPMPGYGSRSFSRSGWQDFWASTTEKPRKTIGEFLWRSSWSYSEELNVLKSEQAILDCYRAMQTNQSQFYKADFDRLTSQLLALAPTNTRAGLLYTLKIPDYRDVFANSSLNTFVTATLVIETGRRVAVTAIAIKRFQIRHGREPATLNELTPEFLPAVPIDPYDGKPLKYHPNPDNTYLLYSVGEDGVDDGGNPTNAPSLLGISSPLTWQNPKARDWVWPQPATPTEVQYFYEHLPH